MYVLYHSHDHSIPFAAQGQDPNPDLNWSEKCSGAMPGPAAPVYASAAIGLHSAPSVEGVCTVWPD